MDTDNMITNREEAIIEDVDLVAAGCYPAAPAGRVGGNKHQAFAQMIPSLINLKV